MSFIQSVSTIVIAILLESLPYVLLGVLISAVLQTMVSDSLLQRWMPKRTLPGILFGCLLGLVFPLCECGIIPVVHRLIRKGMPPYIGLVFIMAGPIINPIVFISTFQAFRSQPEMAFSRIALAFVVSAIIGWIASRRVQINSLRQLTEQPDQHASRSQHAKSPFPKNKQAVYWKAKLHDMLEHAAIEMFDVGKFIVLGALATALLQTAVSKDWLLTVSSGSWTPHLFMMGLSYVLSICSTADAFVGVTFLPNFSMGSVLAFLVFGAMFDIKSTFMLLKVFRFKTVAMVLLLSFVIVLVGSVGFDWLNTYF
ncbi:permease [Paenibacillus glycanilyticus]|uniref:Permease n=1 Tax=Paenibacillus glycanilyticus TaxID=126569 RepID=A0ABQ6G878_9BACL|nr:permease [Paenibacillus glycanilyticus]GLX66458.1 hypothetical protein MU1_08020 [Paenibacillus glycanilyticus]